MNKLVCLISPPSRSINHFRPPLALLYLAGHLQHHRIPVKIIDIPLKAVVRNRRFYKTIHHSLNQIEEETLSQIRALKPHVVGITCYTPEYEEVLRIAQKIKKINPKIRIVIGGIHPTLYPDELLSEINSPVDFEVIGEGEQTFLELCQRILGYGRKPYSQINGIAFYKSGRIIKTKPRPINPNLDDISHPAYNLIDMNYYTTASPYAIRGCFLRSFYLLATRGCPSTCTFCVAKKLRHFNGGGQYTRIRSAQSLIAEIKLLKKHYHIDSFYFIDDLFTINKENVIRFCQKLVNSKLSLLWGCSSKVSTLNPEIIELMSKAGCIQIDFGVERGSDEALRQIQKNITIKMVTDIFSACHRYGIRTFANFLINLPAEKAGDLEDIITLSQKLKSEINSYNIFTPYPGTEIYDQLEYKYSKNEYKELFNASELINSHPYKYRFASHRIDLVKWAFDQNRRFNHILPNLVFHLKSPYLKTLFRSGKKTDYLKQMKNLLFELANQKFNF